MLVPCVFFTLQTVLDAIARSAIGRERLNCRRRLLWTDDPSDGLIDRCEIGRHFVAHFL